jgi:hypothetical protein
LQKWYDARLTLLIKRRGEEGQQTIEPLFRFSVVGYTDMLYDVSEGIRTIDKMAHLEVPYVSSQNKASPVLGFRYVRKLFQEDIDNWSEAQLKYCPAPLVIHLTDGKLSGASDELEAAIQDIMDISIPDGNVLVEHLIINNSLTKFKVDKRDWRGYILGDDLVDSDLNRLLGLASTLPESYRAFVNDLQGLRLQSETKMLFPGSTDIFYRECFVVNQTS